MKLTDVLKKEFIISDLLSNSKDDALKELSDYASKVSPNLNSETLNEILVERENLCSTAIDEGVAIPHGKLAGLPSIFVMFARSIKGIDFESLDGNPTHFFVLLIAPDNSAGDHIHLLARISKIFKEQEVRDKISDADTNTDIYEILLEEDAKF